MVRKCTSVRFVARPLRPRRLWRFISRATRSPRTLRGARRPPTRPQQGDRTRTRASRHVHHPVVIRRTRATATVSPHPGSRLSRVSSTLPPRLQQCPSPLHCPSLSKRNSRSSTPTCGNSAITCTPAGRPVSSVLPPLPPAPPPLPPPPYPPPLG